MTMPDNDLLQIVLKEAEKAVQKAIGSREEHDVADALDALNMCVHTLTHAVIALKGDDANAKEG